MKSLQAQPRTCDVILVPIVRGVCDDRRRPEVLVHGSQRRGRLAALGESCVRKREQVQLCRIDAEDGQTTPAFPGPDRGRTAYAAVGHDDDMHDVSQSAQLEDAGPGNKELIIRVRHYHEETQVFSLCCLLHAGFRSYVR